MILMYWAYFTFHSSYSQLLDCNPEAGEKGNYTVFYGGAQLTVGGANFK